jgi:hypothetical protein
MEGNDNMVYNNSKNSKFYDYLPFIVFFILILFIHFIVPNMGDDKIFAQALNGTNFFDYIVNRYFTWTSRIIIEFFLVTFNGILPKIIWQLLDTTMYTLIVVLIAKIFNKKANRKFNWLLVIIFLLYPFGDLGTAGFVTTTISYIWPMACMLYSFYIIDKIINEKELKWYNYLLAIITTIICCNMEQNCAVFFGFAILSLLYLIMRKKFELKKHYFIFILLIICSLELIFILTCPGNDVRSLSEIKAWFPVYESYNLIHKLYLGIVPTASLILYQKVILFLFSLLLMIYTFINNKHEIVRILSVIVFSFFMFFGMFKQFLINTFPSISYFYNVIDIQNGVVSGRTLSNLLPLILIIIISLIIFILLLINYKKELLYPMIFLASLASRMIMGFSPTIFASCTRTMFILYIGILILIYTLYMRIVESNRLSLKCINLINYLIIILAIFSYFNTIFYISTLVLK